MKKLLFLSLMFFVLALTAHSQTATVIQVLGSPGTANGQLSGPVSIARNSVGQFYIAEFNGNRIQRFNADGSYSLKWGSPGSGDGQFATPSGVAYDGQWIYVADYGNNRVQKFGQSGTYVRKWGSTGTANGQFTSPFAVAATPDASVVIVGDSGNNRFQHFSTFGDYYLQFGGNGSTPGSFNNPLAFAIEPSTYQLFVADTVNHRIQRLSIFGSFLSSFGSLGSGNGQLNRPSGIAIGPEGKIYVSDAQNCRIQRFRADGTFEFAFGSFGSQLGQFNLPYGLIAYAGVNGKTNVAVTDYGNSRVQIFSITEPDVTAPILSLTGKTTISTKSSKYTIKGTSSDSESGVSTVTAKVNTKAAVNANGTTSWSYRVTLKKGYNKVIVQAADASGNLSLPITVKITRK